MDAHVLEAVSKRRDRISVIFLIICVFFDFLQIYDAFMQKCLKTISMRRFASV